MKRLSEEQLKEIETLYKQGLPPKKIGEKFGIANNSVTRILKKKGIERNQAAPKITQEIIDIISSKYLSGISSEEIAKDLGINSTTVCRHLKKIGIKIRPATENKRKYWLNDTWLDKIDSQEKAYFLGLLWADGTIAKNKNDVSIRLQTKDELVLIKLSKLWYEENRVRHEGIMSNLSIYSEKIKKRLIDLGAFNNKAKTIKFPTFLSDALLPHFLRGMLDGDGCISVKDTSMGVVCYTGNQFTIPKISEILFNNNISNSVNYNKEKDSFNLCIKKEDSVKFFLDWIYKDSKIHFERKKILMYKFIERYNQKYNAINIDNIFITKQNNYSNEILELNGQKLTSIKINNTQNKEEIAHALFKYYRETGFPFPNYSNNELLEDWKNLIECNTSHIINNNIIDSRSQIGLKLFKHFAKCYFNIKTKNKPSMIDAFSDDQKLMNVIKNRLGISYKETFNITDNMIRQGFRNSFVSASISIFKPLVAKTIYDIYAPPNGIVYDPSMGMGQRLLGAMASKNNLIYVGTDPWAEAIKTNNNILNFINTSGAHIFGKGSEHFNKIEYKDTFDLVFTSPPYYNTEIYSSEKSQSYNFSYDYFINSWWNQTVNNIYYMTKTNGIFALNISNKYLKDMLKTCTETGFKEINRLYLSYGCKFNQKIAEPIIIMQKI